ncbi:PucR family transcriptional regulator [Gallicola sp. Sow4_E12]|uniref:PucR family transcriptional regulator n=1 Tax=Gallicola sp. Sow4_E12 TaxID=3438785 RepID=UPI003F8DAF9F
MGLLLTGLERERKKLIEERIAKKIPEGEFQELKEILFAYGDFNKSISKSSEKLFIHKNTFQYKLNKIYEYTGYDPKVLNDYILLYVSFLIRDVYREKEE